jgi:hypothetical protein
MLRPIVKTVYPHLFSSGRVPRAVSFRLQKLSYLAQAAGHKPCAGISGGAEEIRTPDPLHAKQMLSQLSYGPRKRSRHFHLVRPIFLVGHGGLEPPTSVLSGPRSNQLS